MSERDHLTAVFRAEQARLEYDLRFGPWERFVELMEGLEVLCGQWPPPRPPFEPPRDRFLL